MNTSANKPRRTVGRCTIPKSIRIGTLSLAARVEEYELFVGGHPDTTRTLLYKAKDWTLVLSYQPSPGGLPWHINLVDGSVTYWSFGETLRDARDELNEKLHNHALALQTLGVEFDPGTGTGGA